MTRHEYNMLVRDTADRLSPGDILVPIDAGAKALEGGYEPSAFEDDVLQAVEARGTSDHPDQLSFLD